MNKWDLDTLMFSNYSDSKVKCKCGHSIIFGNRKNKVICTHCGYYVYKDTEEAKMERFKDKFLQARCELKRKERIR